jgi:hypothetical protein
MSSIAQCRLSSFPEAFGQSPDDQLTRQSSVASNRAEVEQCFRLNAVDIRDLLHRRDRVERDRCSEGSRRSLSRHWNKPNEEQCENPNCIQMRTTEDEGSHRFSLTRSLVFKHSGSALIFAFN